MILNVLSFLVMARTPTIQNGTTDSVILLEDDSYIIYCQSTDTRPASVMSWKLDSSVISDTTSTESTTAENLSNVISAISISPTRQHNGSQLICESHIPGQTPSTETSKIMIVWCKYRTYQINSAKKAREMHLLINKALYTYLLTLSCLAF